MVREVVRVAEGAKRTSGRPLLMRLCTGGSVALLTSGSRLRVLTYEPFPPRRETPTGVGQQEPPQVQAAGASLDLALYSPWLAFVGGERGDADCPDKERRLAELGALRTAGALSLRPLGREKQRVVNSAVNR